MERRESHEPRGKSRPRSKGSSGRYKVSEICEELKRKGNLPVVEMRRILGECAPVLGLLLSS